MKNIWKIAMMIVIVIIGSTMVIKNVRDIDKGYVVSDIENKSEDSKENIIKENDDNKVLNQRSDTITIYISGEVKSPGVVKLNVEDRLADGVSLCGGLTEDANLNGINLAMRIQDEGHYIIPKIGDEIISNNIENNTSNNNDENIDTQDNIDNNKTKINLNTATVSELDALPGFGEITAQKIVDYRQENTKFNSIEEIKNIKGIGDKKFNDVKDYICVQ